MKTIFYTVLCLLAITIVSCSKIDNYAPPSSTITGSTIDEVTGQTVQTEFGGGGTRVKLLETSYSSNPVPIYFQSKQDGTFNNTKVFAATYRVSVEGPFVPVVQTNSTGTVVADSSQNVVLNGTATLNFKVQPFLRIEWVGKPVVNADKTVTVQVKVTRGTNHPSYQLNITDINLYVSNTQNAGNNNYDPRYSMLTSYSGTTGTNLLGQTITITTTGGALAQQDVYFRVGARINAGLNEYNYNAPLSIGN